MTKEIKLTQGKVAIVDDEDFERLNQFKWYAANHGGIWYAARGIRIKRKVKIILMHRKILNVPKHLQADHRNGNGLNNQRENLRICTNQQNNMNKIYPQRNNKLNIKGVYWNKQQKKFKAQIQLDGKIIYLGLFNVLGDADSAYRIAEEKYFGEFARMV